MKQRIIEKIKKLYRPNEQELIYLESITENELESFLASNLIRRLTDLHL